VKGRTHTSMSTLPIFALEPSSLSEQAVPYISCPNFCLARCPQPWYSVCASPRVILYKSHFHTVHLPPVHSCSPSIENPYVGTCCISFSRRSLLASRSCLCLQFSPHRNNSSFLLPCITYSMHIVVHTRTINPCIYTAVVTSSFFIA